MVPADVGEKKKASQKISLRPFKSVQAGRDTSFHSEIYVTSTASMRLVSLYLRFDLANVFIMERADVYSGATALTGLLFFFFTAPLRFTAVCGKAGGLWDLHQGPWGSSNHRRQQEPPQAEVVKVVPLPIIQPCLHLVFICICHSVLFYHKSQKGACEWLFEKPLTDHTQTYTTCACTHSVYTATQHPHLSAKTMKPWLFFFFAPSSVIPHTSCLSSNTFWFRWLSPKQKGN